jgi:hypothetical protein
MAHYEDSIPESNNHIFMPWLANYETQINTLINGGNAPDGQPYFYPRATTRWTGTVVPAITALQNEWTPVSVKGTHTSGQTKQFDTSKKLFLKNTFRPFNKEFVLYHSQLTVQNRAAIGILPVAKLTRTAPPLIVDQCFASFKSLGSCMYEIRCRSAEDASRASCPEGKIVQFAYNIVARVAVGAVQPAPSLSAADCPLQGVSSHAKFTYDFEAPNAGKIMYVFFRWFDLHHPEKSGPWGALMTINLA